MNTSANELYIIHQTLQQQREGLADLTEMIRKDMRDIKIIQSNMYTN